MRRKISKKREYELARKILEDHRKRNELADADARAEQAYELRANFEPGTVVVNILTGARRTVR